MDKFLIDIALIIDFLKSLRPKVRRFVIAAGILCLGIGAKQVFTENQHDAHVIENAATHTNTTQNIETLKAQYDKLTPYQKKYAKLLYYEKLKCNFDKEGLKLPQRFSATAQNWINAHLKALHPNFSLHLPEQSMYSYGKAIFTGDKIPHPHPSVFVFSAYEAQAEKPLYQIKVDTKTSAAINLYHVIAAESKNQIRTKDDIEKAVYKLEKTMTYQPPKLTKEQARLMHERRARVNAVLKEHQQGAVHKTISTQTQNNLQQRPVQRTTPIQIKKQR